MSSSPCAGSFVCISVMCNLGNASRLVCCVLCRLLLVARSGGSSKQQTVTNAAGHGVCCMLAGYGTIRCVVNPSFSVRHVAVCGAVPPYTAEQLLGI